MRHLFCFLVMVSLSVAMLPLRHSSRLSTKEKTLMDPTIFMSPPRRGLDVLYRDYKYPDFRGGSLAQRPLIVIDGRIYPVSSTRTI